MCNMINLLILQLPSGYPENKGYWLMKKAKFDIGRGCSNDFVTMKNLVTEHDKTDDKGTTPNEAKVYP